MNRFDLPTMSPEARIPIWREAIAHLRYLNDEVWKRFQFFLSVDVVLILASVLILREPTRLSVLVVLAFTLIGIFLTLTARYILKRNRVYYLQMLLKKTLLEEEAGFYGSKFSESDTDMAFPWRLTPEVIKTLRTNPEEWIQQNIDAPATIARRLFQIYEIVIAIFGALLVAAIVIGLKL
ncbi:MAG: hypothetical protein JWM68_4607 [Verrucomicrobiales bacterium]|nr:hypothetical protein [Verrucomicrobiales bacterium]